MTITRKTYIELAKEFGRILGTTEHSDAVWQVIHAVSNVLQRDNDRFDRQRFEQAIKKDWKIDIEKTTNLRETIQ